MPTNYVKSVAPGKVFSRGQARVTREWRIAWCNCRVRCYTQKRIWDHEAQEWGPWRGPEAAPCCGQPLTWYPSGTQRYQAQRATAKTPFSDAYEAYKRDLGLRVTTIAPLAQAEHESP